LETDVFRNAKPASLLLGAAVAGLAVHITYALLRHHGGEGDLFSDWAFYGLALLVLGAGVARGGLVHDERVAWTAGSVAFGAWFMGSVFYASGGAEQDLSGFPVADALLLPFAAAAGLAVAKLVRSRVTPFQPTILLDGLIVALAAGAVIATVMHATILRDADAGAWAVAVKLAYPVGAVMLLVFVLWVQAVTGWRLNRTWTAAVIGLALAAIASTAFMLRAVAGDYAPGTPIDSLWLAGGLVLAYAAWQPHEESMPVRLARPGRLGATSVAAAAALIVLLVGQLFPVGPAAVLLAAATLVALISRAAIAFKESRQMFADARNEAETDALTNLGNRRKLMADLRRELHVANAASPRILVMFDLDGFKRYNDTFGHPAGDVLLARLGSNLDRAIRPYGHAYRIGGDEFCVLVMTGASSAKTIIALAASALSEQGEGFAIKASHGTVMLPHEARDATLALRVADQRMYAQKEDRRSSATRQARDLLLQVLHEREPALGNHMKGVANLALGVGTRLSLIPEELDEVVRAAELHDVGKMAIPDEILRKSGPLTQEEWGFVRRHTLVGERILSAAPALLPVAKIVRASHERWDGSGYPDGIAGEEIPLGARIVAVCDAFDAMITFRPYSPARPVEEALRELRACAGTQFDPAVVAAFCEHIASLPYQYGPQSEPARAATG
jgi:diguanylate cyclase (GGDEF)-like protein